MDHRWTKNRRRTFGDFFKRRFRSVLRFEGLVLLRNRSSNAITIQQSKAHLLESSTVMMRFHHRESNTEKLFIPDRFDCKID